jgi:dolichol-phosphate mannosyltransferase
MPGRRNGGGCVLSVVVPCFNEEEVLPATHERLTRAVEDITPDFEIVYVDDGSRDATAAQLCELQLADPHVRVVRLTRNFGHQVAATAGLAYARGRAVVLIDADLQDPPEVIPEMFRRWQEGFHVVYGQRTDRAGESRFKLWSARAFYRLINRLSEVPIPLDTGDFRLMDRRVVEALCTMHERHRLLRGMTSWVGFHQVAVPYSRSERHAGVSKYPLHKMLALALDGIFSFSTVPLRFVTLTGMALAAVSALGVVYALVLRLLTSNWVPGWTMIFIALLLIGGVQLVFLGVVGEYVGRIYTEAKDRPLYLVLEERGFSEPQRNGRAAHRGRETASVR